MKTRFKTKQEINSTLSKSEQDYLFGLPWEGQNKSDGPISLYPELTGGDSFWNVSPEIFTTDPHPYDGKSFKIRVTPKESEMVQKKAFALGYKWGSVGKNVQHVGINGDDPDYIFFPISKIMHRTDEDYIFRKNEGIELTPQQFMDGDLPKKETASQTFVRLNKAGPVSEKTKHLEDVERLGKYYITGADPFGNDDAYIDGGVLHTSGGSALIATNLLDSLHSYNLMSKVDFQAKYPQKLKFKGWDVTTTDLAIKIGCEEFSKSEAR